MVKYIQLACEEELWRALFLPPEELEGFRIPLVESRVLSPTPRTPQSARGILDSFNRIPGAVPRPQGTPES